MIPIILCGGSGTRLWPLINQKLFYKFINSQSLLEKTLNRLNKFEPPFIISVEEQKENLEKILQNYKKTQIIYEPFAKNTAVSVALACFILREKKEETVGVFPADHFIEKESKFQNLIAKGVKLAKKENKIVTFGIPPDHNSSSYGYIKTNNKLYQSDLNAPMPVEDSRLNKHSNSVLQNKSKETQSSLKKRDIKKSSYFQAKAFIEKPTTLKAKTLIKAGSLWNSGIFISPIDLLIQYFETYLPELWHKISCIKDINLSNLESLKKAKKLKYNELHSIYKNIKPISFDKGIMENVKDYLCILCDVAWTDLGSWEKIAEWDQKFPKKLNNKAEVTEKNSVGNFIFSSEEKNFNLIGLKNYLIINSPKGLLIADKKQVKNISKDLHKQQLKDINTIKKTLQKQQQQSIDTVNKTSHKQQQNIDTANKASHKQQQSIDTTNKTSHKQQQSIDTTNKTSHKQQQSIDTTNKTSHKQQQDIDTMKQALSQEKAWVEKPWGTYRVLMEQEFLKYKELKVNPKSQLSYQSHKKRTEHWIIKEGSAEVLIEGKIKKLTPNKHIFIDQGVRHRLKNPTNKPLFVLEIQIGQCLEEDIIRYKDDYGRT